MSEELWFDEKAAARVLKLHPSTLRRYRRAGKVRYGVTPGGRIRYQLADLIKLGTPRIVDPGAI